MAKLFYHCYSYLAFTTLVNMVLISDNTQAIEMSHLSFKCNKLLAHARVLFLCRVRVVISLLMCVFSYRPRTFLHNWNLLNSISRMPKVSTECICVVISDNRQRKTGQTLTLSMHKFFNALLNDTLKLAFKGNVFLVLPVGCISLAIDLYVQIRKCILWNPWVTFSNVALEESLKEKKEGLDFRKIKIKSTH